MHRFAKIDVDGTTISDIEGKDEFDAAVLATAIEVGVTAEEAWTAIEDHAFKLYIAKAFGLTGGWEN